MYKYFIGRKQEKMTTLDFKISLPDQILKEAEAAGLLNPKAIERLLRDDIRRKHIKGFFTAADKLFDLELPEMSDEEIQQEIHLSSA